MLPITHVSPAAAFLPSSGTLPTAAENPHPSPVEGAEKPDELREVFHQFVGETFFRQMLSSMRQTVGEPAYFHGGRAEETFQSQLDTVLAEKMTQASDSQFSEPMFELFQLSRR